ncbi:MAG: hypothetical protein HYX46_09805 [Betaproteobacteria bacterium]|nr:hypothetical protein [Betaproteobacteria bacterium]
MNYVLAGTLALVLAIGGCASGEVQKLHEREVPWNKAATARTRADQLELAAWYEREAASARERAAVHRQMRDSYASSSGYLDLTGIVGHCTNLVGQYAQAAKDSAALAGLHRRFAGEAKE